MPAPTPFRRSSTFRPRVEIVTEHYHCPCGEGVITCQTVIRQGAYKASPEYSEPDDITDGEVEPCAVCGNAELTASPASP